jgi:hypothetical protein
MAGCFYVAFLGLRYDDVAMMSFRDFVGTSSNAIWRLIDDLGVDANAICMQMQDCACLVPKSEELERFQMSRGGRQSTSNTSHW